LILAITLLRLEDLNILLRASLLFINESENKTSIMALKAAKIATVAMISMSVKPDWLISFLDFME